MGKSLYGHGCAILVFLFFVSPSSAALTIECLPDETVVSGNDLVTITCHISSTSDVFLFSVQLDFPCAIRVGAGGTGTLIRESISVDQNRLNPPFLFATKEGQPISAINNRECRIGLALGPLEPPVLLADGETRYLATLKYRVSECARGSFRIAFEGRSSPPRSDDLTRVDDATRQPLPFVPSLGQLSAPTGCSCLTAEECDDENECTTDNCAGSICQNDPNTEACEDGLFCTSDDVCRHGICAGSDQPGPCAGSLRCDEANDICRECAFDLECQPANPCKTGRCDDNGTCFVLDRVGSCEDGLFCTMDDTCKNGVCTGTSSPCAESERCEEETHSCIPIGCPDATITNSLPRRNVIDGRQPHPQHTKTLLLRTGIGGRAEPIFLTVSGTGAGSTCFILTETAVEPELFPNRVAHLNEGPPGTYQLFLARPISTGAVTYLYYDDGSSTSFISHPGNTNDDFITDEEDLFSLVRFLEGREDPPYGLYSLDINHSGAGDIADVIHEVDLLNGADLFDPWLGEFIPR